MRENYGSLLEKYLQLPARLESALVGLPENYLDITLDNGWSIRAYVHHTVEGELMWQLYLRAILGHDGIEFPIRWYFELSQDEWANQWAYNARAIGPTISLFRASTSTLVELLKNITPEAWKHYGRVTWPGDDKETLLTVRDILLIHIRHVDQHVVDIRQIRDSHRI